jgi:hypothetical protein
MRNLIPAVTAGLAVVLICGVASAGAARVSSAPASRPAGPPPFYAIASGWKTGPLVRSTATGRVTARVPAPPGYRNCDNYVAAAARETFFMICSAQRAGSAEGIFRFRLTSSGRATRPALIAGHALRGLLVASQIAASPDGSELALQVWRTGRGPIYTNTIPAGILVVSTRTGRSVLWRSVPERPAAPQFAAAQDLSFTAHGNELVALETRCPRSGDLNECSQRNQQELLQAYYPARRGGSLEGGQLLVRQSSFRPRGTEIFDAFIRPGGTEASVLLNHCPRRGTCQQWVAEVPVAGGGLSRILFRASGGTAFKGVFARLFGSDPTGRYLILNARVRNARLNGWLDHGRLRPLTPANGSGDMNEVW